MISDQKPASQMPVRTYDDTNDDDDDFGYAFLPKEYHLLPDDIWEKFEVDYTIFDKKLKEKLDALKAQPLPAKPDNIKLVPIKEDMLKPYVPTCSCPRRLDDAIRNHDCMWAGHCFSAEHPRDESFLKPLVKPLWPASQQSLLKPTSVRASMPQTPPMSDDDEEMRMGKGGSVNLMKLLGQDVDDEEEDMDLYEYFEDNDDDDDDELQVSVVDEYHQQQQEEDDEEEEEDDDEEEEDENEEEMRSSLMRSCQFAAESDHSYHKGGQAVSTAEMLGIDTPSDSEEEIDVVSVVDKTHPTTTTTTSSSSSLHNRPTYQYQRRILKPVSKKTPSSSSSIKTILPIRKAALSEPSTSKKKQASEAPRGVKRPKQYRVNPSKRRNYSSDSDPEPSEKRNLHNNMERQRRIDLRNAFEDLRVLVPEVSKKERAAKVVILREAAQYCDDLTVFAATQTKQQEELKRRQEWLRHRVSQLRKNLAAKR